MNNGISIYLFTHIITQLFISLEKSLYSYIHSMQIGLLSWANFATEISVNNLRASPAMQNMSEHVYYSEPQRILYRLLDSTHITQTIVGNTLVTEQPQYSSKFISLRIMQISVNGLIYNDLHGNQCNNFHIPNCFDFLWDSNTRKWPWRQPTATRQGVLWVCFIPAAPVIPAGSQGAALPGAGLPARGRTYRV